MERAFVKADKRTQRVIFRRLDEVIEEHPDGTVDYKDGHSDATVAKELGVKQSMITHSRREGYGNLRSRQAPLSPIAGLEARLTRVEAVLDKIHPNVTARVPPLSPAE